MLTTPTHNEELILFRRVAAGDETAYTRVFHLFTPRLLPYLVKITKDDHIARELLQETFLRLWLNRADLTAIELPASWLFRIAANLSLTYLRTRATHHRLQPTAGERPAIGPLASPAETLEARDLDRLIQQAVDALPTKRREIYRLSREQGLSHREIADRLQVALPTVKNQLGLSLQFIRQYLHETTGLPLAILATLFLF